MDYIIQNIPSTEPVHDIWYQSSSILGTTLEQKMVLEKLQNENRRNGLFLAETHFRRDTEITKPSTSCRFAPFQRIEFPCFNGDNPRAWIDKANNYFQVIAIPEDKQVDLAVYVYFEGDAKRWFDSYVEQREMPNWHEFVKMVLDRFEFKDAQQESEVREWYTPELFDEMLVTEFTPLKEKESVCMVFDEMLVTKIQEPNKNEVNELEKWGEKPNNFRLGNFSHYHCDAIDDDITMVRTDKVKEESIEKNKEQTYNIRCDVDLHYECRWGTATFVIDPGGHQVCKYESYLLENIIVYLLKWNFSYLRGINLVSLERTFSTKLAGKIESKNHKFLLLIISCSCFGTKGVECLKWRGLDLITLVTWLHNIDFINALAASWKSIHFFKLIDLSRTYVYLVKLENHTLGKLAAGKDMIARVLVVCHIKNLNENCFMEKNIGLGGYHRLVQICRAGFHESYCLLREEINESTKQQMDCLRWLSKKPVTMDLLIMRYIILPEVVCNTEGKGISFQVDMDDLVVIQGSHLIKNFDLMKKISVNKILKYVSIEGPTTTSGILKQKVISTSYGLYNAYKRMTESVMIKWTGRGFGEDMSVHLYSSMFFRCHEKRSPNLNYSSFSHISFSLDTGVSRVTSAKTASTGFKMTRERIAKLIHKLEISISTCDITWFAMVPSPHSLNEPRFPNCIDWLLESQCSDGSWARPHHHPLLTKDILSSTLACLLALRKWGVGEEHITRGVHFIELNFASASDESQISPMGFDIIFAGMLEYAKDLVLNLDLETTKLNNLIHKRDLELKRCYQSHSGESEAYLGNIAEGMEKLQKWDSVMNYQRKNGSPFNSPSTSAAAFMGVKNDGCLNYLNSALKKFGNAVPTVYPFDIYAQLCTVDNLERLGISKYFRDETQSLLDETYRYWLGSEEEIFLDASTCALAFRILQMNGYDVTSDPIAEVLEEDCFSGNIEDIPTALELYRTSKLVLCPDELDIEKQSLRLKHLLKQELCSGLMHSSQLGRNICKEVNHVIEHPFYATMEQLENRRNIEHYNFDSTRILKTSYCSPNFGNKDFFYVAVEDFNQCQIVHREELKELETWVIENRLDELNIQEYNCDLGSLRTRIFQRGRNVMTLALIQGQFWYLPRRHR